MIMIGLRRQLAGKVVAFVRPYLESWQRTIKLQFDKVTNIGKVSVAVSESTFND